jgi:hypothetical protein
MILQVIIAMVAGWINRLCSAKNHMFDRNGHPLTYELLPMMEKGYTLRPMSLPSSSNIVFKSSALTTPMRS